MLNSKSYLGIDFGAGTLKVAEFDQDEAGSLRLLQFGVKSLGIAGSQDKARDRVILKGLQELIAERGFATRSINACAPGYHVFSKFVKLPPVDASKLNQIIQYEAQQNVPFPLEEVVWDYHILGNAAGGEVEVLLIAIKTDVVEGLFKNGEAAGLNVNVVDVSPAALTNAFRYNYNDLEGCTMLLDIGAKTSNVLFFEKDKVYARSINIGANNITQDFATNIKAPFVEAERIKIEDGFVSLGGAYAEPDNANQAAVSKIARQVMTRLHIQVNQTIQFYRGQQGGSAPDRFFLAGGASVMPYTQEFFAEKLNLPVEYFNPFRNVNIDPSVNIEELASVAHSFGEVVGLGLRGVAQCPVEMNLIPKSALKRQQFGQKKPYFIASVAVLIAGVLGFAWYFKQVEAVTRNAMAEIEKNASPLKAVETRLRREESTISKSKTQITELSKFLAERFVWLEILGEVRKVLAITEEQAQRQLGVQTGVWIENFVPTIPGEEVMSAATTGKKDKDNPFEGMDARMMERYGLAPDNASQGDGYGGETMMDPSGMGGGSSSNTNSIDTITINCRAINMTHMPSANSEMIYILQEQLKKNPLFVDEATKLSGELQQVSPGDTDFGFEVTLKLANPIEL